MEIKPITADRLRDAALLYVNSWKETYRGLLSQDVLQRLNAAAVEDEWRAYLLQSAHAMLAAYDGSRLIGFLACKPDDEVAGCIYLDSLHVASSARGQGTGTALINAFFDMARQSGYVSASVCVVRGNDRARALYVRLGAEHCKFFTDSLHGGVSRSEKLMWRVLPH